MEAHARGHLFAKRHGVVPEAASSESAMEHALAPEKDAFLSEEDTVKPLAMPEEDEIVDDEEVQASPPLAAFLVPAAAAAYEQLRIRALNP